MMPANVSQAFNITRQKFVSPQHSTRLYDSQREVLKLKKNNKKMKNWNYVTFVTAD